VSWGRCPTEWDKHYCSAPLKRPTNLDPLYPDPFGHWEDLEDLRVDRIVTRVVRAVTLVIAIGGGWTLYALVQRAFA